MFTVRTRLALGQACPVGNQFDKKITNTRENFNKATVATVCVRVYVRVCVRGYVRACVRSLEVGAIELASFV